MDKKPPHPVLKQVNREVDRELERRDMNLMPIVLEAELDDEGEIEATLTRQGPDPIKAAGTWETEQGPETIARRLVDELADKLDMD